MNCLRCNSPMYEQLYDDVLDSQGQGFYAMHCLMRGDIVDPVILKHRRSRWNREPDMLGSRWSFPSSQPRVNGQES